jgi:hypothetical protein
VRLLEGLADDPREGYPLIAVDPRPWEASRATRVGDVLGGQGRGKAAPNSLLNNLDQSSTSSNKT